MTSGHMMNGSLECSKKDLGGRLWETKVSKHQDGNTVGDSIVTAAGVIHSKGQRVAGLTADITQEKLVQAGVDGPVAFATAMLKR